MCSDSVGFVLFSNRVPIIMEILEILRNVKIMLSGPWKINLERHGNFYSKRTLCTNYALKYFIG